MGEVGTIGLDLAKNVFQVHGADTSGAVLVVTHALEGNMYLADFFLKSRRSATTMYLGPGIVLLIIVSRINKGDK